MDIEPGSMRISRCVLSGGQQDGIHLGCIPPHRHECQGNNFQDETGDSSTGTYLPPAEAPARMISPRTLLMLLFASAVIRQAPAQIAASQPESISSEAHTLPLTVPDGTPLQIALDSEVRVRKAGQPIHRPCHAARLCLRPSRYPHRHAATGHILAIAPVPVRTRTLSALNADFSPARKLSVNFGQLILPGGRTIELHATVVPGSGQVIQLATAGRAEEECRERRGRPEDGTGAGAVARCHEADRVARPHACLRALRRRPAPRAPAVPRCRNRLFRRALPAARLRQRIRLRREPSPSAPSPRPEASSTPCC